MFGMVDIDVGTWAMHIVVDMPDIVGDTQGCGESCEELFTKGKAVRVFLLGHILDVHLGEDLSEELHAMFIVQGHELVVLLLGDVVTDGLTVDDSGHAVLDFTLGSFVFALFLGLFLI